MQDSELAHMASDTHFPLAQLLMLVACKAFVQEGSETEIIITHIFWYVGLRCFGHARLLHSTTRVDRNAFKLHHNFPLVRFLQDYTPGG